MGPKNRKPSAKAPVSAAATAAADTDASEPLHAPKVKANPKNQYHHIIPRFILRKFIIEGHKNPDTKRRNRNAPPVIYDPIYRYHVPSGTFSVVSINNSYGIADLYIDAKNADDVYEVEKKLSVLESHAAQAIAVLHRTIESRPPGGPPPGEPEYFKIKRKFLNYLRKFMFVMYFRKDGCRDHHFSEKHPDNFSGVEWIRAFRRRNNLEPSEAWLHVLKHYLNTSHTDLIVQGETAQSQLGPSGAANFRRGIDPDIENAEMIQYSSEANNFFLAVWEAADGEEFVISNNSFGICDWMVSPGGDICPFHRFYVISPRIAIVLCSSPLRPDSPPIPEIELLYRKSMFWGAPHRSPRVSKDGQFVGRGGRVETYEEDTMEYEIVKISKEHTHLVNAVILGNVKTDTGAVTFRTPAAMLRTLKEFSGNINHTNQTLYIPLFKELLKMTGANDATFRVPPNLNPASRAEPLIPPKPVDGSLSFWEMNFGLVEKLETSTDPLMLRYFRDPLKKLLAQASLKIAQTPHDINPRAARLRREMTNEDSRYVFAWTKKFIMDFLGLRMSQVFPECASMVFLRWLLAERRLMFEILEKQVPVTMMEWVYDHPESKKLDEEYRRKIATMFSK